MNDLRYALRQLLKNLGFTVVAVLTLALGIGANSAIFQLLDAVRLKSLLVSKPQELIEVRILAGNPGLGISDGPNAQMTYPLWEQIQSHRATFSGLFAWGSSDLPIGNDVETRMVRSLWASGEFFSALGVAPVRGRLFDAEDDQRGGKPGGVVISYAFWQSEFGGQDSAIGKSLTLGDRIFQVIGVTPPAFFGLEVGKTFGVVRDTKYANLREDIPPIAFAPARQRPISGPWAAMVVRSSGPLPGAIAAVKQQVSELDPSIRMGTSVLRRQVREGLARERLMAWLSGFFGLLAAVLVIIGLYRAGFLYDVDAQE